MTRITWIVFTTQIHTKIVFFLFLFLFWFQLDRLDDGKGDIVTADTVEQLIGEIGKIKSQMNNTELQLYEANEKIAELVENVSWTNQF